jgi:hypothetical protein
LHLADYYQRDYKIEVNALHAYEEATKQQSIDERLEPYHFKCHIIKKKGENSYAILFVSLNDEY